MRSYRVLQGTVTGLGVGVCLGATGQHYDSAVHTEGTADWALGAAGFVAGAVVGSVVPAPTAGNGTRSSIVEAVGNTPLVELRSLSKATGCRILAKAVGQLHYMVFILSTGATNVTISLNA